jgi:hypothetical protein
MSPRPRFGSTLCLLLAGCGALPDAPSDAGAAGGVLGTPAVVAHWHLHRDNDGERTDAFLLPWPNDLARDADGTRRPRRYFPSTARTPGAQYLRPSSTASRASRPPRRCTSPSAWTSTRRRSRRPRERTRRRGVAAAARRRRSRAAPTAARRIPGAVVLPPDRDPLLARALARRRAGVRIPDAPGDPLRPGRDQHPPRRRWRGAAARRRPPADARR